MYTLQWLQKLQSFINTLLQPIIKDQAIRNKYLTSNMMAIWGQAFTHETASPSDNYEDLEYLGDAVLKAVFPKYLRKRFPYFHKGEYTELNAFYMSGIMHANLSRQMGLGAYIRVTDNYNVIVNIESDVLESFFGALDTVSDLITDGLGYANCYNMILHLFKNIEIDEKKGIGATKTQVIQMFTRFDLPDLNEVVDDGKRAINVSIGITNEFNNCLRSQGINIRSPVIGTSIRAKAKDAKTEANDQSVQALVDYGLLTVTQNEIQAYNKVDVEFRVVLQKAHVNFLSGYGVTISNPVIGYASAPTKREAKAEAYNRAFKYLDNLGITTEWADKAKQARDFSELPQNIVNEAFKRAEQEGFERVYFSIPRKTHTREGAIVQLIGQRSDESTQVLSDTFATERDNSFKLAKSVIVEKYAKHK